MKGKDDGHSARSFPLAPPAPELDGPGALAALPAGTVLAVADLTRILGRSSRSITRALRRGELPAGFRLGNRLHWTREALLDHFGKLQDRALRQAGRAGKYRGGRS